MDSNIETGPAQAVSRFNAALTQAGESQRALIEEIGQFAREESLRFFNLRLERTSALIDKLSSSQGVGGIFAAQQEWLRDLIADYTAHNMRMAGAVRGMAHTVVAQAADAAGETVDHAHAQATETMHQADQAMGETQQHFQAATQDMGQNTGYGQDQNAGYGQEMQH